MVLHVTCVDSAMLTTRFWPFFFVEDFAFQQRSSRTQDASYISFAFFFFSCSLSSWSSVASCLCIFVPLCAFLWRENRWMHRFILGKRPLPFALFRHYLAITVTRLKKKKRTLKSLRKCAYSHLWRTRFFTQGPHPFPCPIWWLEGVIFFPFFLPFLANVSLSLLQVLVSAYLVVILLQQGWLMLFF